MFFTEFQSFEQALEQTKTFRLEVTTISGQVCCSSDMPESVLQMVLGYIDVCQESKSACHLWDYHTKAITIVPSHAISTMRVILIP